MKKIFTSCSGCGDKELIHYAVRADGMEIVRCIHCGLGVVKEIPTDLSVFYDDNYYSNGNDSGYKSYELAAEHGVGWAAHIVKLTRKSGKILDIGCADGYLLRRIGTDFDRFGIEVNKSAREKASSLGIKILGNSLFDPNIHEDYSSSFDVITSIAVFEHLEDFYSGFKAAANLLRNDGVLLFEVPILSETGPNDAWLNSSFEHVFYPTEQAIRHIVESRLKYKLAGAELKIKEYASTYIGFVTKSQEESDKLQILLNLLLCENSTKLSAEERIARLNLQLIHMAQSSRNLNADINLLNDSDFTKPFAARLVQLWDADLRRQNHWHTYSQHLESERVRLSTSLRAAEQCILELEDSKKYLAARVDAAQQDLKFNLAQAMQGVAFEMERSAIFEQRAATAQRVATQRISDIENTAATTRTELEAIRNSTVWRATQPLRLFGARYPSVARRIRQVTRLVYWILKLELRVNLKEVKRRRVEFATSHNTQVRIATEFPYLVPLGDSSKFFLNKGIPDPETEKKTQEPQLLPACEINTEGPHADELDSFPYDRPLVSVVIPCFNYGHLVNEAVESVLKQTFKDIEIIVVEGGSTSIESRHQVVELLNITKGHVRVLFQKRPTRVGANRNLGIEHANGKYICCLDADDHLDPTFLEKAVFFLEHYEYDVVSSGLKSFGDRNETWITLERPTLDILTQQNQVLTCAVYRRSLWRQAGGYRDTDPATGHIHEDWLFWVRLAALGARFYNVQEPLLQYRTHGTTLSNNSSVLDQESQVRYVNAFNSDVLTPEAFSKARKRSEAQLRARNPLRNLARKRTQSIFCRTLLLAVPYLILGGAEKLLSAIVQNLSASGWKIIVVSTVPTDDSHGDTTNWFKTSSDEIYHLPRFLNQDYWKDFIDYLFESRKISLLWIVGSSYFYDYLPALKSRQPDLKVVDLLFNTIGHTSNNRRYAAFIDMNLVENAEVRQWLIDSGESPSRIRMIASGVDIRIYRPVSKKHSLLDEHDVPPGNMIVGFSGRWSEEKDPLAMIEIAKRLPETLPVTFMMTGAGPLAATLQSCLEKAKFSPSKFIICGAVPDVGPYLNVYDILVLPSLLDGRPNVVMEALASGVAVVASKVGALPELIEHDRTGFLCAPANYDEFAQRLIELISDPRKITSFKREARLFAERQLDIRMMLVEYQSAFDELIDERKV